MRVLRTWSLGLLLVGLLLMGPAAWGQLAAARVGAVGVLAPVMEAAAPATDATVGEALRILASRAQDVFVGQVVGIVRKGGVVEISFRVDQGVVGAAGGSYVLREWAGLWPPGQARYFVGQRAMVFVGPAAAGSGLSEPVDGAEGVVPVVLQGVGVEPVLDVQRLAARVVRANGESLVTAAQAGVRLSDAMALVAGWRKPVFREPVRLPLPVPMPVRGRVVAEVLGGR